MVAAGFMSVKYRKANFMWSKDKAQTLLSQSLSQSVSLVSPKKSFLLSIIFTVILSFSHLLRFLSILSIFAILSCSGSENSPIISSGNTGTIIISYRVPIGVYKVRAAILDTNNNPLSGFQKEKDVTPGESVTIIFNNLSIGTYNIKLEGLDAEGSEILYTGQTNNVAVTKGGVAEPSVVAKYTRSDIASPGSSNHNPANGSTNIPANTKISVQVSDADAGVDVTSIILTVNNEDITSKCSIIGTSDNYTITYAPSSSLSGTVTITLRASDLANPANYMSTETWSFEISSGGTTDTTAPSNPAISLDNITETASQVLTVTISASDDTGITGYYLSESETAPTVISDGWISVQTTTSYNSNVSFTLSSGNGNKTIYVWFMDGAGNISQSSSAAITLNQTDTTVPSIPTISISGGATSTTSTVVTLLLSVADNIGVTAYYVSENSAVPSANASGWKSVASSVSYSAVVPFTLSSGSIGSSIKTVYVWFRDEAGNISASTSDSITLTISDSTAPSSPSVSINNGDTSTTTTSVTLTLSATDNVGVTGYYASETSTTPSASASGWTSVTSTTNYSATVAFTLSGGSVGDNTKTVYVWFKDSAGNVSASTSDSITLTISDSTAPSSPSVLINNGDTSTTSTSITLALSATDNVGVTGYCAKETSTTPSASATGWTSVTSTTSYSATVSFTLSSGSVGDNTKTVYVWFRDSAGNVSSSASDLITLTISDSTTPSSPMISINSGALSTTSTSVTLTLSATDNVGVTGYYASETSTTPSASATGWTSVTSTTGYSATVSFTLSSESQIGTYTKTVYVWFKDAAGNVSASSSDSITLTVSDTTAPTSPSVSINNG